MTPLLRVGAVLLCSPAFVSGERAVADGPAITGIAVAPGRVGRYERVEITFTLSRAYDNPFDPGQIAVAADLLAPSGHRFSVPAFPYQDYESALDGDQEHLTPAGDLVWKVRFAPTELGRCRVRLVARDAQGESSSREFSFEATKSRSEGFIRRSARAPRRFAFDSSKPYFAIGENVCWASWQTPLRDYDLWFRHLSAADCNYARLWLVWGAIAPIDSSDRPEEVGPGRFSLRRSWRLDRVIEMAEQRGIYLMICLDSFNSLRQSQPYPMFDNYILNAKFDGPLKSPDEFWTSAEARRLFERRLRYYVARWGYSTHVFAWEFWNEVDIIEHYDSKQVTAWHREMARTLRSLDPWRHLITTSFARSEGDPAIDALPEMDFVQTHSYGARDIAGALLGWSREKARYGKPHLIGEFGADASGKNDMADMEGVHLHNGIWASALSGDAGAAMTWWWDSYVEPRNLYPHFAALARFLRGADWIGADYAPARIEAVVFAPGVRAPAADLTVDPKIASWEKNPVNQPREFRVGRDGTISDVDKLSRVLHGLVNHREKHNPPTFLVDYPADGAFEVIVDGVSGWGGANLRLRLDGETKLAADFPDLAPDDHETMRQYDGAYRIAVPAGPHRITVENEGADWAYVSYRFVGYLTAPNLRVVGLANPDSALLWLQNKAHTWWNVLNGPPPQPVPPARVTLAGLRDGAYAIEWWDTYAGRPVSRARAVARGGHLVIAAPAIARDVACRVARRAQAGQGISGQRLRQPMRSRTQSNSRRSKSLMGEAPAGGITLGQAMIPRRCSILFRSSVE